MVDSVDEIQVPQSSSPKKGQASSSSPLKISGSKDMSLKKFAFKPNELKAATVTQPDGATDGKVQSMAELEKEFPGFSSTLIQAVVKSNLFDFELARARLSRIKAQRETWSKNSPSPTPVGNSSIRPTQRFSGIGKTANATKSTKITVDKPKTSIFDRYSSVMQARGKGAAAILVSDLEASLGAKSKAGAYKKRKLVRGDAVTQLDKARDKLLEKRARKLMDKETSDTESEGDEEEEEGENNELTEDVESEGDEEYQDSGVSAMDIEEQTLKFLNEADPLDIADLSDTTFEKAQIIVSRRPYTSLVLFNDMDFMTEEELQQKEEQKATSRRRIKPKKEGERFLEKLEMSIRGYNAIESLLKKCSSYGTLISKQISKWGATVNGSDGSAQTGDADQLTAGEEVEGLQIMTVDDDEDNSDAVVDEFDEAESSATPTAPPTGEISDGEESNRRTTRAKTRVHEDGEAEDEDDEYVENFEEVDDSDDEEFGVDRKKFQVNKRGRKGLIKFFRGKPRLLSSEMELKDYQQTGINWLNLLYHNQLSCILADDMGLGKTCQVISFIAYLKQINEPGPHLIVVPSSTLENWLREFKKFCPALKVEPYYGSQQERADLRDILEKAEGQYDVMVTTYNLAAGNKYDVSFLRNRQFNVVVYDEGHMLKNSMSERFNKLMRIRGNFRLLLTGTPLQNNLKELMSLLEFIMPSIFISKKDSLAAVFKQKAKTTDDNKGHNPLLVQNAIKRAKTMMTPFILRRRKDQVLKHLPAKHSKVVICEMNETQQELYNREIQTVKDWRTGKLTSKEVKSKNLIMSLRKASLHPLLFRHIYKDRTIDQMSKAILREPAYAKDGNKQYIMEDMSYMSDYELHQLCLTFPKTLSKYRLENEEWMDSGKIVALRKILHDVIEVKREKIIVFSLFTQVLDILELVLNTLNYKFLRLDGSTAVNDRQGLIDTFYEDATIPVFILSTKAGGFGINLVCANHVVIFDQSFNPHDDRQAADRSHRVGQTKEVTIHTLVTRDSIEEKIHQLAKNKLALDTHVSGADAAADHTEATNPCLETAVEKGLLDDIIASV
ncbi:DNA-dependent ATPase FUN30 KNAG_0D04770 [Huiozyma naganishii CBS 8797]|uniref:DNA helicase n=1 Tax=Huiozyma naganishii (strain ATCC MYA-139 / BCRC 22969 / CBS 8797 / KCTC 17520 / NBRC 10181 / NCYC 3082 / Yp74L-3) TaxID=1071383 RepID=J7RYH6_HUIN7|nr:hypothetical protein KNAG_0D04770 [Kazachstania naganishii CBS 8797]CCK70217.1 hypothetical protein KNAG_0D04770 [Kazachstania naganishii CBS 8797]